MVERLVLADTMKNILVDALVTFATSIVGHVSLKKGMARELWSSKTI